MLELQARKLALSDSVLGHDAEGVAKFDEADLQALLAPLGAHGARPNAGRSSKALGADGESDGRRLGVKLASIPHGICASSWLKRC